jgi:2-polyprenyl-3-methyl-5-hydroxy-6-metoxy-1,4-benzoquinol methylase
MNVPDDRTLAERLAIAHPINDYYERAPLPIRLIERRRLTVIRRFVGPAAGLDILEVGSGGGHVLRMFPEARLTALDVSETFLEQARRNLSGLDVRYLLGEIDAVGLKPRTFDRIICTEVLEHTLDPESILSRIAQLLRPDGAAVVTVPNDVLIGRLRAVAARILGRRWVERRASWGGEDFHRHHWGPTEFQELLARHLAIEEQVFVPSRLAPIRLCYRCRAPADGASGPDT